MTVYAILKEYVSSKPGIHVHAAILVNGHKEPPIVTFAYKSNPFTIENRVADDVYKFLEKNIPKDFTVYTAEEYGDKYGKILDKLRHRFITVDIRKFPKILDADRLKHMKRLDAEADVASKECLELIITKTNKQCV